MKYKQIIIGVYCLFLTTLSPGCCQKTAQKAPAAQDRQVQTAKVNAPATVDVDELLSHPEKYIDKHISVNGIVARVDSGEQFRLGCEDACLSIPVEYEHVAKGERIFVKGTIKRNDEGKLYFAAEDVAELVSATE